MHGDGVKKRDGLAAGGGGVGPYTSDGVCRLPVFLDGQEGSRPRRSRGFVSFSRDQLQKENLLVRARSPNVAQRNTEQKQLNEPFSLLFTLSK